MKQLLKVAFLVGLLVSLGQSKIYKIGFAQDTLANDWRKAQADEAIKEVAKYDFLEVSKDIIIDTKVIDKNNAFKIEPIF